MAGSNAASRSPIRGMRADVVVIEGNEDHTKAPVRLMTNFLKAVQIPDVPEALRLADQILEIEPGNSMIQDYRTTLLELRSVNDAEAKASSSSDEEEDSDVDAKGDDEEEDDDADDDDDDDDAEEDDYDAKEGGATAVTTGLRDLSLRAGEQYGESKEGREILSVEEHEAQLRAMFDAVEIERLSEAEMGGGAEEGSGLSEVADVLERDDPMIAEPKDWRPAGRASRLSSGSSVAYGERKSAKGSD